MADLLYWLWYTFAMGGRKAAAEQILSAFGGDVRAVYDADAKHLEGLGVSPKDTEALSNKDLKAVNRELWFAQRYGVRILARGHGDYPRMLREIHTAPFVLYVRGEHFAPDDELLISIVGTRRCTGEGRDCTRRIARELGGKGVTVVSGMARGIDTAAHLGALDVGGKTLAVLGCGVNVPYPKENRELMQCIMKSGAVVSEFPFDTPPLSYNFPQRNRIISGLSQGVLVAEASERSGALITADCALDQGRDVFALPGSIVNPNAAGVNKIIQQGAKLVRCADDILEEYEYLYGHIFKSNAYHKSELEFSVEDSSDKTAILSALQGGPRSFDALTALCGIDPSLLGGLLTMLELDGEIRQLPGKIYERSGLAG